MKRVCVVVFLAIGGVLATPPTALAIDHVVLYISPTKLAQSGPLKAWTLDGAIVDSSFYPTTPAAELFGVTLHHRFLNGRAEEIHAFRAAPGRSLSFDGAAGRWDAQLGAMLTVRLAITATGDPRPVSEAQACRGAFMRVPVTLRGTFTLPTRTRAFKTVRRTRLSGTIFFNSSGPVSCGVDAVDDTCTPSSYFSAQSGPYAQLLASPDEGGWLTLSFRDRLSGVEGAVWYHVMRLTRFNPLAGSLPRINVRIPASLPVRGNGVFTAAATSARPFGACQETIATGTFDGVFRTRFTGWGARTFTATQTSFAAYSELR